MVFISAFIITTIIHECGHYFFYLLFDANPTLFHNYVQTSNQSLPLHAIVISALAGPLFSLFQGLIFGYVVNNGKRNTPGFLVYLWLSLLGFVNFFGYLVMTPFTTTGDTGKVAELINMNFSIRILIACIGFVLLLWIIFKVAKNFSNFIPAEKDAHLKAKYIYQLMFFPIMAGSLVNVILAFPVVAVLSIIYPATSSYVIMSSFPIILKSTSPNTTISELEVKIQSSLVVLILSTIVLNRLLTMGIG